MYKADLHCHTRLSDGTMGIDDMIKLAKDSGVTVLSITDHDCVAGIVRAKMLGERHGIKVIPGVEISTTDKVHGKKAHMLCYLPDIPDRLEKICAVNSNVRKRTGQLMAVKASKKFPITIEFIMKCATGSTNIFKQHIMHALKECGYTTTIYGELFNSLFKKTSPENILVELNYVEPQIAIRAIHDAGGIAVLAHPGMYDNFDLLDDLVKVGLDGVEVWHPANTLEQQEELIAFAKKHKILTTGGSDFHGGYNSRPVKLGDYGPPEECVAKLLNYKTNQRRKKKREEAKKIAQEKALASTGV